MLWGAVTAGVDRSADSLKRRQPNGVFEGTLAIGGATFSVRLTRSGTYGFYYKPPCDLNDPVSSSP